MVLEEMLINYIMDDNEEEEERGKEEEEEDDSMVPDLAIHIVIAISILATGYIFQHFHKIN